MRVTLMSSWKVSCQSLSSRSHHPSGCIPDCLFHLLRAAHFSYPVQWQSFRFRVFRALSCLRYFHVKTTVARNVMWYMKTIVTLVICWLGNKDFFVMLVFVNNFNKKCWMLILASHNDLRYFEAHRMYCAGGHKTCQIIFVGSHSYFVDHEWNVNANRFFQYV